MQISRAEESQIKLHGNWDSPAAQRLSNAWFSAIAIEHKLPDWIRYMYGMSGKKYRYLINNLVAETPNAKYLEIGSWKGSTACSAVYGNNCRAFCIDNWSEFLCGATKEDVRKEFENNIKQACADTAQYSFIDKDFRSVDFNSIGRYNIYLFDGPHSEQDQYDGIVLTQSALESEYILIVDDWNVERIRLGTSKALNDLEHKIICGIEILTRHDHEHPVISMESSDWHNGYFIAVVNK